MWSGVAIGTIALAAVFCGSGFAAPVASIPGVGKDGIKRTTTDGTTTLRFPIDITAAAKNFYVNVDDFRGPNSQVVSPVVKLNGSPADKKVDLSPTDRPTLVITGVFGTIGDYTSNIVVFHDGVRDASIPIVVTRQLVAVSIQVDPIDSVSLTLPPFQSENALIRVSVRETSGLSVTMNQGELVSFVRKQSDKAQISVDRPTLELATPSPSLTLGPQGYGVFSYVIKNLKEPGEYTGTFRIGSTDRTPVDKTITVFVRASGWVAFLFIFLGVLASYLIRYWTKEGRPKLESLRRAASISEDLDLIVEQTKSPNDTETKVFLGIRLLVSKAERNVQQAVGGSQDANLSELETKVANLATWLTLANELSAVAPASIVATSVDRWTALADSYFLAEKVDSAKYLAEIGSIKTEIEQSLKDAANLQIEDFKKTVSAFKAAHPGENFLDSVTKNIEVATKAVGDNKLKEAGSALEQARSAYARGAAAYLKVILAGAQPLGFDQASWQALGQEVNRQVAAISAEPDATKAIGLFDELNRTYIRAIVGSLAKVVAGLKQDVAGNTNIAPDKKAELTANLEIANTKLTQALAELDGGAANTAQNLYTESTALVVSIDQEIGKSGAKTLGAHGVPLVVANFLGAPPGALNVRNFATRSAPEKKSPRDSITDWIQRYNFLLNVGLLIIATVIGLEFLWADNVVWGGLKDYVVAFLWGLGLQQIGASGLDGLPAITKKLTD